MSETSIRLVAATNVGLIRQNNEDNFVVCPSLERQEWTIPPAGDPIGLGNFGALLVVADGMGGANAGEVASAIAVEIIQQQFAPERLEAAVSSEQSILDFMKDVVKLADRTIAEHSKTDTATRGMGTTVVMAWIVGQKAFICWCGDSRCYVFNPASGLIRLSKDHSFVQQLVDKGELTEENAYDHPYSNVITQCLGDTKKRANPDTRTYELLEGDTLLLCSDGLSSMCHDSEIIDVMTTFTDIVECKSALIEKALTNGGHDNVTIALAQVSIENDAKNGTKKQAGDSGQENIAVQAEAPDTQEENISDTLETARKTPSYKKWLAIMLLLLIIAVAVCVWLYYKGLMPENIVTSINKILKYLNI